MSSRQWPYESQRQSPDLKIEAPFPLVGATYLRAIIRKRKRKGKKRKQIRVDFRLWLRLIYCIRKVKTTSKMNTAPAILKKILQCIATFNVHGALGSSLHSDPIRSENRIIKKSQNGCNGRRPQRGQLPIKERS